MDLKTEDDIELITELKALLYPQFPPGCHEQDFLAHVTPLASSLTLLSNSSIGST